MSENYSEEELRMAVERLSDPAAFEDAEKVIATVAPDLQGVLVTALGTGGWFGESLQSETLKAATVPDEEQRIEAVRALLSEETHLGMMVGVAVGWALRTELAEKDQSDEGDD